MKNNSNKINNSSDDPSADQRTDRKGKSKSRKSSINCIKKPSIKMELPKDMTSKKENNEDVINKEKQSFNVFNRRKSLSQHAAYNLSF